MKKLFALCLALCLALSVFACAAREPQQDANSYQTNAPIPAPDAVAPDAAAPNYDFTEEPASDWSEAAAPSENAFISTREQAISTFSADVDTASYTYWRKLVNQGYSLKSLIATAGSAIRTEEFVNYFDYDYVQPNAGELFGVHVEMAQCPWNESAVLMVLGLQTEAIQPTTGNNLVFLIDVSGSMAAADKLVLLKESFSYLTEQLTENDVISIVTYSGREAVELDGCAGSDTEQILRCINRLSANGSTNGQAGLSMAYQIAEKHFIQGGNNRIILASDGDLNVGITSDAALEQYVSEMRGEGVYLSVLGFGTGNYRDSKMETIADNGNGVYYYIDSIREAQKVFGKDLLATLYTVAEDVKLQLTFDPEQVAEYRLIGYENRLLATEDFLDDTKDAGEVGAGHTVTVCYELQLTPDALLSEADWMTLAIRYKQPGETMSLENDYTIGGASYTREPDRDFAFVSALIELSMLLRESAYGEKLTMEDVWAQLAPFDYSDDVYKAEFLSLLDQLTRA